MINRFGFRVVKEEQNNGKFFERVYSSEFPYIQDNRQQIKFVEVELNTPRFPKDAYCSLYYKRYMARTEIMPLETLKIMFPKSYSELDSGEEYIKEFGELK